MNLSPEDEAAYNKEYLVAKNLRDEALYLGDQTKAEKHWQTIGALYLKYAARELLAPAENGDQELEFGWVSEVVDNNSAPIEFVPTNGAHLNTNRSVAVADNYYWNESMADCPLGVKVQLLGAGGVAVYAHYHGDPFWEAWAPLPKRRPK